MVPPGETTAALLNSIREVSRQPAADWAVPPEPLRGGIYAEVFKVRLTGVPGLEDDLVARVMPHAEAAAREVVIQTYIAEEGFPTPRIRMSSPPTPQLDHAWSLMDFVRGSLPLEGLSGSAMILTGPRMLTRLPDRLARMAAALHSMDPAPLEARISARDELGAFFSEFHDRAGAVGLDELRREISGLERSRLEGGRLSICHGDFHPFNVLSGPEGEVLLDWTAARIADPLLDVAFSRLLFAYLPIAVPRMFKPLLLVTGGFQARRFLSRYERYTGEKIDRDRLAWFTRLQAVKMLVELEEARRAATTDEPHPYEVIAERLRKVATEST